MGFAGPARSATTRCGADTWVVDLVLAMRRTGCLTRRGLDMFAAEWDGVVLDDDTRWQEVRRHNVRILTRLGEDGLSLPDATSDDAEQVVDHWGVPLASLDLHEIKVGSAELEAERGRLTESFYEETEAEAEWESGA